MSVDDLLRNPELVAALSRSAERSASNPQLGGMLHPETLARAAERAQRGLESNLSRAEEAIILREGRPVYFIRDDRVEAPDGFWAPRIDAARAQLERAIPAVGRILLTHHPQYRSAGTGWLVAPDVVITNRHVARLFARASAAGIVFDEDPDGHKTTVSLDFAQEHGSPRQRCFKVVSVIHIEEGTGRPDLALLKLSGRGDDSGPQPQAITLSEKDAAPSSMIAAIGYPEWDGVRNVETVMESIFGGVYDVKRFHPGEARTAEKRYLTHDCSTLGGNSGSVLLDFESGHAVGLHYAGDYQERNFAVKSTAILEVLRRLKIANDLPAS
jgi:endonuclease G, mitochondrial